MLFTEPVFMFIFLPLCLILQYLIKNIAARNIILLVMSLVFYAWGEPVYVFLMIGVSLIGWTLTKIMHDNGDKENKRNIGVCIFLSIITFGIYGIYWMYSLIKNTHLIQKNTKSCIGEMLCLVFVPFYSLYWWYTRGEKVKQTFSQYNCTSTGSGIAYLILAILKLNIVSMAIMQNDFNSLKSETFSEQRSYSRKKSLLAVAVVVSLIPLLFFKYGQMILDIVNLIPRVDLHMPELSLPIGISFYSFQILTYVIDVYRGQAKVQKNPLYFMLYISLFPQLIAGPIVRYTEVEKELQVREIKAEMVTNGIYRFMIGMGKKVLLANVVGRVVTDVFEGSVADVGTVGVWGAMLCYTFQIYFDFSGYSDMAIGLGKMLGFTYGENFNYPYISTSIKEFWRRWHISMSTFFRDYIYIPLGGNRKRRIFNMFVVWATTGLWHGAGYNFVLWGLYYFVLLVAEGALLKKIKIPKVITLPVTFVLVIIGWVLFYFEDLGECLTALQIMFGFGSAFSDPISTAIVKSAIPALIVCTVCATPLYSTVVRKVGEKTPAVVKTATLCIFTVVMFVLCTSFTISNTYNPFLYFKF